MAGSRSFGLRPSKVRNIHIPQDKWTGWNWISQSHVVYRHFGCHSCIITFTVLLDYQSTAKGGECPTYLLVSYLPFRYCNFSSDFLGRSHRTFVHGNVTECERATPSGPWYRLKKGLPYAHDTEKELGLHSTLKDRL